MDGRGDAVDTAPEVEQQEQVVDDVQDTGTEVAENDSDNDKTEQEAFNPDTMFDDVAEDETQGLDYSDEFLEELGIDKNNEEIGNLLNEYKENNFTPEQIKFLVEKGKPEPLTQEQVRENLKNNLSKEELANYGNVNNILSQVLADSPEERNMLMSDPSSYRLVNKVVSHLTNRGSRDVNNHSDRDTRPNVTGFDGLKQEFDNYIKENSKGGRPLNQYKFNEFRRGMMEKVKDPKIQKQLIDYIYQ